MSATKPRSKHFCVVPFVHFSSKADGHARVCCFSRDSHPRDEANKVMHLGTSPLKKIWHSGWMNDFRARMLGTTPLPECQFCYREEAAGKISKRLNENRKYQAQAEEIIDHAHQNQGQIAPYSPIYFDIRLGNLCNLKCRTCNPTASSAWAREVENNLDSPVHISYQGMLKDQELPETWFKDPYFWSQFAEFGQNVEEVYLSGGEPMLIKEYFKLLQQLVDSGHAERVTLRLNSNTTLLPQEFLTLARHFKKIAFSCSIDGLKEQNDWLRSPSKWQNILTTFEKILNLPENFEIDLNCTVSVFNIFYYAEFVRFFKSLAAQHRRSVHISADILHDPGFMRLELLPAHLKPRALAKLAQLKLDFPDLRPREKSDIDTLMAVLQTQDPQESLKRQRLAQHINSLDKIRNENFQKAFPEIAELAVCDEPDLEIFEL